MSNSFPKSTEKSAYQWWQPLACKHDLIKKGVRRRKLRVSNILKDCNYFLSMLFQGYPLLVFQFCMFYSASRRTLGFRTFHRESSQVLVFESSEQPKMKRVGWRMVVRYQSLNTMPISIVLSADIERWLIQVVWPARIKSRRLGPAACWHRWRYNLFWRITHFPGNDRQSNVKIVTSSVMMFVCLKWYEPSRPIFRSNRSQPS